MTPLSQYLSRMSEIKRNEPRPTLWRHFEKGNSFIASRPAGAANPEGFPIHYTHLLADNDALRGHAYYFPFLLHISADSVKDASQQTLYASETKANLSEKARSYLQEVGFNDYDESIETASLLWFHSLAIGYSNLYLEENMDGIQQDFPRIPLPAKREDLIASAGLGEQITKLLDSENEVNGVTVGNIDPRLRTVGIASHPEGKQFEDDDFMVTAGWGHGGQGGVTMPGKGKLDLRYYSEGENAVIDEDAKMALGVRTYDVYLNDLAYWRNVPEKVWNYYIGGYQVIKKWLSYREYDLLGRPLTVDEVTEVTNMIRRISAILLLEPQLNDNYQKIKANTYKFEGV